MYQAAREKKLLGKPGGQLVYSDQGYFLLGLIIERVSGKLYPDYLQETFFKPLGMNASRTEDLYAIIPGLASGYLHLQGKWLRTSRRTQYGMASHYGVISTVGDLAKWATALMQGKVLKPESLRKMWTPGMLADGGAAWIGPWNYGFGWFLRHVGEHRILQHPGSTGTNLTILPDQKLAVVVLTNLEQITGGDATSIARSVYRLLCPEVRWTSLSVKKSTDGFEHKLKEEIGRIAAGKIDEGLYAEPFTSAMKSGLSRQQAALAPLGPVTSVDLVDERAVGREKVSTYRFVFKDRTIYGIVVRNNSGKVIHFTMEQG